MNRRRFVHGLALGSVAAAQTPSVIAQAPESASTSLATTPLTLQAPRSDGLDAVWAIRERCLGRIEWEADDGSRGVAQSDSFGFTPQGTRILHVRVTGLQPGVAYRIRSITRSTDAQPREEVSDWKPFKTLNPGAAQTRFTVWNDTHVNNETIGKLDDVTPASDFHIWNGDTCNDWHREEDLIPTLLHPGGRDITRGRPLHVLWGNHDVRGPWAFRVPELIPTPSGRPFHAFRSGPVAVVCLHTGEDKPDNHPSFRGRVAFDQLRAEQAAWLDTLLRSPAMASAPYRVVFCHIPLRWLDERPQDYAGDGFDRHSGRSRAAWHDALVRWKAQVIVSGHTHRPAWIPGTAEFPYGQIVGGGPQPTSATWIEANADAKQLQFTMRKLDGQTIHQIEFPPVL